MIIMLAGKRKVYVVTLYRRWILMGYLTYRSSHELIFSINLLIKGFNSYALLYMSSVVTTN